MHENQSDEYLEALFHLRERHQLDLESLEAHVPDFEMAILAGLVDQGHVRVVETAIHLTDAGFAKAEKIVRQHRIAERLLTDVMHMDPSEVEEGACEFEHLIADEITESICILLGHPRTCPHGSPIPEGECCRAYRRECPSLVVPLTEVPVGASARIAYVNTREDDEQHRLAGFGVVPGSHLKLHQRKPSIVVVLENSRLAMEPCTASEILVWKTWSGGQPAKRADESAPRRRRLWPL